MTHLELERESVLGKRYLLSLVRHLVAGSIILHVLLEESCTVHSKQNIEHPMAIGLAISSFIKYVQVYALQWQSEKKKKKTVVPEETHASKYMTGPSMPSQQFPRT